MSDIPLSRFKVPGTLPPGDNATIRSIPPTGKCAILNMYWDPDEQKVIYEYEDEPEPAP
jgi:hypothetical protein